MKTEPKTEPSLLEAPPYHFRPRIHKTSATQTIIPPIRPEPSTPSTPASALTNPPLTALEKLKHFQGTLEKYAVIVMEFNGIILMCVVVGITTLILLGLVAAPVAWGGVVIWQAWRG
ncbi:hypothetical protein V490_01420 [Pseudogymnoascus sp. VKM F-3557]|nr:hypothetical protein V490_01420 [Pseudogymnoascus sp. VKM F-3557]